MQKNSYIQIWRAFAIIAVVFIHTCPGGLASVMIRPFLNFCVAAFVFLSGYLTKADNRQWIPFFKKRILKVLIPYIIWSLVYTMLQGDYLNIFIHLIKGSACVPFYYILVYIQLVLLTPLCVKLIRSKFFAIGLLITPISLVLTRYILPLNQISLSFVINAGLFSQWFTFYYLGILLGNNKIKNRLTIISNTLLLIFSLLISLAEGYMWYQYQNTDMATSQLRLSSFFVSIVVCFLIDHDARSINNTPSKFHKFLSFIGDYSFGVYLIHIAVMRMLYKITFINELIFPLNSLLVLLVSISLVWVGKKVLGKRLSAYVGF